MQWVVDGVLVSADRDLLVTLGIGFGLLVLLQVATGAVRSWAVLHLSSTLNLQWLGNVFAHLMRLPVDWFEKRHTGDVMSRFGAVQQIQQTLTTSFIEAVLDGLLVVVTLAMMFVYSAHADRHRAGLRGASTRCCAGPSSGRCATPPKRRSCTTPSAPRHFLESLRGVQAIKLFNRQEDRQARFMNLVVDAMNANIATRKLELLFGVLHKLVFGLERVAVIWVGALLVLDQRFSVGMLFAFFAYKEQFALRVSGADRQGGRAEDAAPAGRAPGRHRARRARGRRPRRRRARSELRGAARTARRAASPTPTASRRCSSDLSLAIEPGESVAIVGPSGCGKTTLLKLMLGIHAPQAGEIRVGGVPLRQLGLRAWRDMIGTVMQDDQLFAGSIADNISFFDARRRRGLGRAVRPLRRGARRDRGDADGLPHADRRHGREHLRRAEAAHPAGAGAVQAAEDPVPRRGHQRARRRPRARGQPGDPPARRSRA